MTIKMAVICGGPSQRQRFSRKSAEGIITAALRQGLKLCVLN